MKVMSTDILSEAVQPVEIPFSTMMALVVFAAITPLILLVAPAVAGQLSAIALTIGSLVCLLLMIRRTSPVTRT
ncbi:hypothetical protein BN2475_70100 [Paraburkholderia ribeironis]|uniref:Uncharacterized protein n=1 Tax=Paraburkholderia ribeironis TaxID=1247936 RepID=A0A1N7RM13_9BURK|nr:hypothetical protein [Paraburkholderia ribeironis]SIT36133.1 hypothetical protein BN2475_70100 [Paraburkholderia ribeironis]